MFGNLSGPTLLVILFIVLLLFGAPKLPGLAKSLGQSMRILKKEVRNDGEAGTAQSDAAESAPPAAPPAPKPQASSPDLPAVPPAPSAPSASPDLPAVPPAPQSGPSNSPDLPAVPPSSDDDGSSGDDEGRTDKPRA